MLRFVTDTETVLAGETFLPGEHEIDKPSAELVLHAGSAHAAGLIEVTEGLDTSHVQSQEDAEAAYAAAQGEWTPGELVPAVIERNEDGTPALNEKGEKVVLQEAYTAPGTWSGPWQAGNVLQSRLEQALASGDPDELAAVEADIKAHMEEGA